MVLTTAAEAGINVPTATQWVVFRCADRRFGVPLARVTEIIAPQPFTRLPGAGREVCGLVGVRGRVITVVDFGELLGTRPATAAADYRLLLLEIAGRRVGAAVDEVMEIALAPVGPRAGLDAGEGIPDGVVLGIGRSDDGEFIAIDPESLTARLLKI